MSLEGRDQFEDIVRYEDGRYVGQLLWHMLTNEKPGIISEERILRRLEELGHPGWLGELINQSVVPHSTEDRIQTVAEFRIRLENQGELP